MRGLSAPLLIRALTLGLSFVANLWFLSAAAASLENSVYGVLVVGINLAFFIQSFDFGVTASFTNEVARSTDGTATPWKSYFFAEFLVSFAVASLLSIVILLTRVSAGEEFLSSNTLILIASCGAAIISSTMTLAASFLVGRQEISLYFLLQISQPATIILLTSILDSIAPHPWIIGFLIISSAGIPGLLTIVIINARGRTRSMKPPVRQIGVMKVFRIVLGSGPNGLRQLAAIIGYGLLPTLAGLGGGAALAAVYGMPARVYASLWSFVSIPYMGHWGEMVMSRNVRELARAVSRKGVLLGAVAASATVLASPLLARAFPGIAFIETVNILILLAVALIVRALHLGPSLYVASSGASWTIGVCSLVAAAGFGVLALWGAVLSPYALVYGVLAYSLTDGLMSRMYLRKRMRNDK